jgi:hypothetical protein
MKHERSGQIASVVAAEDIFRAWHVGVCVGFFAG